MTRPRLLLATALFALAPSILGMPTASADGPADGADADRASVRASPVAFDLAAGTHFPVSVGVDAQLELPKRLLVQVHAGWMPPAYLDVIHAVATGLDWYDEVTADLISAAVDNAFVLRLGFGVRPLEDRGFEIAAGYTMIWGGGSVTSAEAIQAASGQSVDPRGDTAVPIQTTLHAIHGQLAWRWILKEHLLIRAAIGWVHTLGANTRIDIGPGRSGGAVDQAEAYLDDILTTYAYSPELKLTLGYRF